MINERIKFPQVRVVDQENNQIGVMPTREAIDMARDKGLDLVLVAGQAQPPVCRIISWGKFKYEQSKKKAAPKGKELKMVRLHPRTGPHDRDILIRNCDRFLRDGHKVRVLCQFKGRENAYPELGKAQMDAIAEAVIEAGSVEGTVTKQGRDMTMMLVPKPGVKPLPRLSKADKAAAEEDARFAAEQAKLAAEAGDPPPVEGEEGEGEGEETEDVEGVLNADGIEIEGFEEEVGAEENVEASDQTQTS